MKFRRAFGILLRYYYLMRVGFSRVMPLFSWIAIDMVLWGFLTRYLDSIAAPGFSFIPMFLGAILLWDFFGRVMQGVTMVFFEDVWSRNFLNVFAAPITLREYVTGLVLTSTLTSAVGLLVMLALATTIFGLSFFTYGAAIYPFLLILFLFGIAFGVFACAMVFRFGPAAEWFIWPIPAFLSPFVGVLYPVSIMPAWMRAFSWALPPTYVFEGMRAIVKGGSVSMTNLAIGGVLTAVYLLLAYAVFTRVYRQAVRSGLLARYSAENVG